MFSLGAHQKWKEKLCNPKRWKKQTKFKKVNRGQRKQEGEKKAGPKLRKLRETWGWKTADSTRTKKSIGSGPFNTQGWVETGGEWDTGEVIQDNHMGGGAKQDRRKQETTPKQGETTLKECKPLKWTRK